ncbi:MAG: hypothetical protein WCK32_03585 [Chlorobiaceae bacterium]
MRSDLLNLADIKNRNTPVISRVDCCTVGVERFFQRLCRLPADGAGWYKPQHHGEIPLKIGTPGNSYGVGSQQSFPPAGRQPETDIRHTPKMLNGAPVWKILFRVALPQGLEKGLLRIIRHSGTLKVSGKGIKGALLKIFQFHKMLAPIAL